MTNPASPAPAGWYPVPGGGQRFWNGREWTPDVLGAPDTRAEFAGLAPDLPAPGSGQPAAAGWYPGPSGLMQWWDGRGWGPFAPQAARPPRDVGIAYIFLLLLGGFGAHRFYLGRTGTAVALICLWCVGWLLSGFLIGIPVVAAALVWLVVDLFLLPSMVRETNAARLNQR